MTIAAPALLALSANGLAYGHYLSAFGCAIAASYAVMSFVEMRIREGWKLVAKSYERLHDEAIHDHASTIRALLDAGWTVSETPAAAREHSSPRQVVPPIREAQ